MSKITFQHQPPKSSIIQWNKSPRLRVRRSIFLSWLFDPDFCQNLLCMSPIFIVVVPPLRDWFQWFRKLSLMVTGLLLLVFSLKHFIFFAQNLQDPWLLGDSFLLSLGMWRWTKALTGAKRRKKSQRRRAPLSLGGSTVPNMSDCLGKWQSHRALLSMLGSIHCEQEREVSLGCLRRGGSSWRKNHATWY